MTWIESRAGVVGAQGRFEIDVLVPRVAVPMRSAPDDWRQNDNGQLRRSTPAE